MEVVEVARSLPAFGLGIVPCSPLAFPRNQTFSCISEIFEIAINIIIDLVDFIQTCCCNYARIGS